MTIAAAKAVGPRLRRAIEDRPALRFETSINPLWPGQKLRSQAEGETRWGRHTIAPIFDPDRVRVEQLMVTSIDVTELVITEKRLDKALTRTLSGFVAICAECKDIKSGNDWVSIEQFASAKMDFHEFSHGLCPKCVMKYQARPT